MRITVLLLCIVGALVVVAQEDRVPAPGECDPLDPALCMLPWPNNFFTRADPSTPTGLRLNLSDNTLPLSRLGARIRAGNGGFNAVDGFPPLSPIIAFFGEVDLSPLPPWNRLGDFWREDNGTKWVGGGSVDGPLTILLEAETGKILAHWVELDESSADPNGFFAPNSSSLPPSDAVSELISEVSVGMEKEEIEEIEMAVNKVVAEQRNEFVDAEAEEEEPSSSRAEESEKKKEKKKPKYDVNTRRMFMMWPVHRLKDGTRYIVAVKSGLKSKNGTVVQPSAAFRALRDNTPSTDPDIESRRTLYEDIFSRLSAWNFSRSDLLLAWDFTTASRESNVSPLVFMRDDAFTRVGQAGPNFQISRVQMKWTEFIARKVEGVFQAPLYLDNGGAPGSKLVRDASGRPVFQGYVDVPFVLLIPNSVVAAAAPRPIVQYGHGLFGSTSELIQNYLQESANNYSYSMIGTDWWGLSITDIPAIVAMMGTDLTSFGMVPDRTMQGILNALLAMRLATSGLLSHPVTQPIYPPPPGAHAISNADSTSLLDPATLHYLGHSCGGILGSVYMTLSTQVERGVLGVPGASFSLLLPRSSVFQALFAVLKLRYDDPLARVALFSIFEILWAGASPTGYLPYLASGELTEGTLQWSESSTSPSTARLPHRVLVQYGLGDAKVSLLAAYTLARSISASMFAEHSQESDEEIFGFPLVPNSQNLTTGSLAIGVAYDGVPLIPLGDIPPNKTTDVHEQPRRFIPLIEQMDLFFRTGEIHDFCGGACRGNFTKKGNE